MNITFKRRKIYHLCLLMALWGSGTQLASAAETPSRKELASTLDDHFSKYADPNNNTYIEDAKAKIHPKSRSQDRYIAKRMLQKVYSEHPLIPDEVYDIIANNIRAVDELFFNRLTGRNTYTGYYFGLQVVTKTNRRTTKERWAIVDANKICIFITTYYDRGNSTFSSDYGLDDDLVNLFFDKKYDQWGYDKNMKDRRGYRPGEEDRNHFMTIQEQEMAIGTEKMTTRETTEYQERYSLDDLYGSESDLDVQEDQPDVQPGVQIYD